MNRVPATFVAIVGAAVVLVLAVAMLSPWNVGLAAQDAQHIELEVTFRTVLDDNSEGQGCGLLLNPFTSTEWPLGRQVLVRDHAGDIVGTVDLADVFDTTQSRDAQPGIIDDRGYCVVAKAIEVADSSFYTFTIDGIYQWTIEREQLESMDWMMPIFFVLHE